jgi:hypothetical protein
MFFYVFMTHSPTPTLRMVGAFSFFPTAAASAAASASFHGPAAAAAASHGLWARAAPIAPAQVSGKFVPIFYKWVRMPVPICSE